MYTHAHIHAHMHAHTQHPRPHCVPPDPKSFLTATPPPTLTLRVPLQTGPRLPSAQQTYYPTSALAHYSKDTSPATHILALLSCFKLLPHDSLSFIQVRNLFSKVFSRSHAGPQSLGHRFRGISERPTAHPHSLSPFCPEHTSSPALILSIEYPTLNQSTGREHSCSLQHLYGPVKQSLTPGAGKLCE